MSDDLVAVLHAPARNWVAVHANHAREFSSAASGDCGWWMADPLVSQSVLLKGVNDNVEAGAI